MKKLVVLLALLAMSGCARMPKAMNDCLYVAQITIHQTVAEANEQNVYPFKPDLNETAEAKAVRLGKAVNLLVAVMDQADKNLIQVSEWASGKDIDPNATK